jgi:hypothetical protein
MSGYDDTGAKLGSHAREGTPSSSNDDRLSQEMRVTFEVEELTGFFASFSGLDAQDLYDSVLQAG